MQPKFVSGCVWGGRWGVSTPPWDSLYSVVFLNLYICSHEIMVRLVVGALLRLLQDGSLLIGLESHKHICLLNMAFMMTSPHPSTPPHATPSGLQEEQLKVHFVRRISQ